MDKRTRLNFLFGIILFLGTLDLLMDNHSTFGYRFELKEIYQSMIDISLYISIFFLFIIRKSSTEKALQNSEQQYRDLFEANNDIIFTLSAGGKFTTINHVFETTTGFSRESWSGKPFVDLIHPEHQTTIRQLFNNLVRQETAVTIEAPITRNDNQQVFCEITLTPSVSGKRLKQIYGAMRNITSRKKAEQDLAAQNERLAVTLCSIGDGVIATDIDGKLVLINPVAERLTGWSQQEALGKPLSKIFNLINDNTQKPCQNPINQILTTGESVGLPKNTALISRKQERFYISNNGSPIRDSNGKIIGAVLVFRDISERRRAEEEMLKSQKLESIGILAGGIAHDFNNILSGILANTQLAKMILEKGRNIEKYLDSIEEAVSRAVSLTRQLLTFSKGGAPVKKVVSIGELIKTTVDFSLRGSNAKCDFEMDDDLWLLEIDPGQISQVINNLVINADQAMPEGGIIKVTAENLWISTEDPMFLEGKYIKISIKDQGSGIPEEHLPYIFDPYFTTKVNGNGLGLATSYSIIKKHEGYIEVQSIVNVGTVFTIYLPVKEAEAYETLIQTGLTPGNGRILLMDDDPLIRETAGEMLQLIGYEVDLAKDGEELLELFKANYNCNLRYDAVITDLTVPGGMGGKVIIKNLLKFDPKVKVIISSGYSNNPVMSEYRKYGFSSVVVKPYKIEDLSRILSELIGNKPMPQTFSENFSD